MEKIILFLKQFWIIIVIGVVGSGVLIFGLWGQVWGEMTMVEIVKGGEQTNILTNQRTSEIIVDVAGAVENPGVYKLPLGSRIGDAIVSAGGLGANADREWVAKTINLAEGVKDGGKIYIPSKEIRTENKNIEYREPQSGKVNINTASTSELDSLSGIGEVRAQTIVANRPYANAEELVSKAKIPQSVVEKIKDQVTIY